MQMRKKLRILILIKGLDLGGAERLLVDSIPYFNQEQFDYHFAYLRSEDNYLVSTFEDSGFPVYTLGMLSNYQFLSMLPNLYSLQKQHQFDLIHAHLPLPGILARIVGRWFNIPVVYTEHNVLERLHPITKKVNNLTYSWNAQVLSVSQGVHNSIARYKLNQKTKTHTLLNGVPIENVRAEACDLKRLRQELNIPNNHLTVGTVAVFRAQKRLSDWLDVAYKVAIHKENVTFILAGYGPEYLALRNKVKALGLVDRVRMPGFRPDGRRILGLLDIYLMSSEFEGLPMALLEAMALSKPVVATAAGGIPEVVQNGQDGYLTAIGDIDSLASSTIALLSNLELRQKLGQHGAKKIEEKFHLEDRIQFTETIYLELLQTNTKYSNIVH